MTSSTKTNFSLSATSRNGANGGCHSSRSGYVQCSNEEYQEFLRYKIEKSTGHCQFPLVPSVSSARISQSAECQGSWILDSGASNHLSGNTRLFSSITSQKVPQLVTIANGSKLTSQGIGKVSLSPSLNLNSVLYIP
ncbi:hypothetical protein VIGAN_10010300, partial [Vigna angularis var. angularis]